MTLPLDTTSYFLGDGLSYSASGLPAGLSIDPATGIVDGTPTTLGSSAVSVVATNPAGSATQSFNWTISEAAGASDAEAGAAGHWLFGTDFPTFADQVSGQVLTELIPGAVTANSASITISNGSGVTDAIRGLVSARQQQPEQTVCMVVSPEPGNRILGGNLSTGDGAGFFMFGTRLQNNARGEPHNSIVLEDPVPQTAPFIFIAHSISANRDWVLFRGDPSASVVSTGAPLAAPIPSADALGIGNTAYNSGSFTAGGSYAEFIVFDTHLTQTEIEGVYDRSKTRLAARGITVL